MSKKLDALLGEPDSPEKEERLRRVARFAARLSGKSPDEEYASLVEDARLMAADNAAEVAASTPTTSQETTT